MTFGDQSTDAKALQSDWIAVGNDIRQAFKTVTSKEMDENRPNNASRTRQTR